MRATHTALHSDGLLHTAADIPDYSHYRQLPSVVAHQVTTPPATLHIPATLHTQGQHPPAVQLQAFYSRARLGEVPQPCWGCCSGSVTTGPIAASSTQPPRATQFAASGLWRVESPPMKWHLYGGHPPGQITGALPGCQWGWRRRALNAALCLGIFGLDIPSTAGTYEGRCCMLLVVVVRHNISEVDQCMFVLGSDCQSKDIWGWRC